MPTSSSCFPTRGSNPGLQHHRQILYYLSHQRSPYMCACVCVCVNVCLYIYITLLKKQLTFFLNSSRNLEKSILENCFLMIFSIKIIFFLLERNWDTLGLNFKQFEVTICLILNDFWWCCSVAKLYLTLCNPMSFMPGFPLLHHRLLEFPQIHVHWFGDTI